MHSTFRRLRREFGSLELPALGPVLGPISLSSVTQSYSTTYYTSSNMCLTPSVFFPLLKEFLYSKAHR